MLHHFEIPAQSFGVRYQFRIVFHHRVKLERSLIFSCWFIQEKINEGVIYFLLHSILSSYFQPIVQAEVEKNIKSFIPEFLVIKEKRPSSKTTDPLQSVHDRIVLNFKYV